VNIVAPNFVPLFSRHLSIIPLRCFSSEVTLLGLYKNSIGAYRYRQNFNFLVRILKLIRARALFFVYLNDLSY